ncbi:MAG: aldo/keto reductase [Micromonosporaceae bacterium]|jgi:2,5-diketo-D-gluconate reductase A|nr:aldo/keto reductase [Micromonosporaceae bacterium]
MAETIPLLHGATIPRLGFGTSPMDDATTETAVATAIEAGYRLVDTAENYANERGVGRGIKASGVPREQLFVTTKFNKRWHGVELAAQALERSIDRLGLDYVDLLLIHWPNPRQDRYVQAWEGLVQLLEQGRVRAIGTSNFKPTHLDRIIEATGVVPDVNQIQLSPSVTRTAARAYHAERGIVTESWSPLGGGGADELRHPIVTELAERYGRTPAQIVLRWHVELGLVAIPKSANPDRIRQNIDIFDFSLAPEDVAAISALDRGESAAVDSDVFGH